LLEAAGLVTETALRQMVAVVLVPEDCSKGLLGLP
jgi:hypothetical protein